VRELEKYTQGLEAYAHDLEVVLGSVLQNQQNTEDVIFPGDDPNLRDSGCFQTMVDDEAAMEVLHQLWRESQVFEELRHRHSVVETAQDKWWKMK
jgi:hypothetical protein